MNFDQFYDANWNKVYKRCFKLLRNKESAEEVTQEAFYKLLKNLDSIKSETALNWVYRTSANACIDILRKSGREVSFDEVSQYFEEDNDNIGKILMEEAKEIVKTFAPKYQEIFNLVFIQGLSNREAAEYLQVPLTTVIGRIHICIKKLRSALKEG